MEVSKTFHAPAALSTRTLCGGRWVGPEVVCLVWRKDMPQPMRGIQPRLLGRPAHSLVIVPTELSGLNN
jgi:hypothetical protein